MSKIFEGLKKYYDETPEKVLVHKAKKLDYLNEIGPNALEYVRSVKSYFFDVMPFEDFNIPESQESKEIDANQHYYLAA